MIRKSIKFMLSKKATKIDEILAVDLILCSKFQIDGEDFINLRPSCKTWTLQREKKEQLFGCLKTSWHHHEIGPFVTTRKKICFKILYLTKHSFYTILNKLYIVYCKCCCESKNILIEGTSMYYYTTCNFTKCNLLLLGKSQFFWK